MLLFVLLLAIGGSSAPWAPWRFIWKIVPILNKVVVPDLNGNWVGTTSSNWPRIKVLNEFAESKEKMKLDEIEETQLQIDEVEMKIKQSLFKITFESNLKRTGSSSHPISINLNKNHQTDNFQLVYVYNQTTPLPLKTDESDHAGAAILTFNTDVPNKLDGPYWTKRSWQQGLNTAGMINIERKK
ncbi:MAG: hypothetical protein V7676_12235 [Parasphingorhabdus sp.]|uniref:Cap15 family cyclic dinucleotide receptor domain-containing protein n=1 Tax=Parasphingorhabdus sp. TaxID=2709688 RepID=UPI00300128C6